MAAISILGASVVLAALVLLLALVAAGYILFEFIRVLLGTLGGKEREPDVEALIARPEKSIALLLTVWRNGEQLQRSIDAFVDGIDYSSYHIFLCVTPNDTIALREAERLATRHNHVHRIVSMEPGPLQSSDSIGALLDGVDDYEQKTGSRFDGFVALECDDIIHPLSLRLLNFWLGRYDIVQIPRYSRKPDWADVVHGVQADDLVDLHGSDNTLKSLLDDSLRLSQVISVVSRELYQRLLTEPWFDRQLTLNRSDFDEWMMSLGYRRRFCRLYLDPNSRMRRRPGARQRRETANQVAGVRTFASRWSDLVQSRAHRFAATTASPLFATRYRSLPGKIYMLWKRLAASVVWPAVPVVAAVAIGLGFIPDLSRSGQSVLQSVFETSNLLQGALLVIVLAIMVVFIQRGVRVCMQYGIASLLMLLPRWLLSVGATIAASWKALFLRPVRDPAFESESALFLHAARGEDPGIDADLRFRASARPRIGEILVAWGLVEPDQIKDALFRQGSSGLPIGRLLLRNGSLEESDLLAAMAEQLDCPVKEFEPLDIPLAVARSLPFQLMRRYRVLPVSVRIDGEILLATYRKPDAQLRRRIETVIGVPVAFCLATRQSVRDGILACGTIQSLIDETTLDHDERSLGWVLSELETVISESADFT